MYQPLGRNGLILKTLMKNELKYDEQNITLEKAEAPSRPPLEGRELMAWTIKAMPEITSKINLLLGSITLIPISMILYGYFGGNSTDKYNSYLDTGGILFCGWLFFWRLVFRQKTIYHYRITDQGAEVEHYRHYPKYFGTFFKGLAIVFLIVSLYFISSNPAFIWMMAGAWGVAIIGAKSLLNWKIEKNHETSLPWEQYNFVTVDRKRRIIVTHKKDPDTGFEYYLPKELFDSCLSTLKTVLPQHVTYNEKPWKW